LNISIELTAIICMSVAGIFWLAGLSFATNRNKEDLQALVLKQQRDNDALVLKLEKEVSAITLKHEGLDVKFTEIWKELTKIGNLLARMEERSESHSQKD
jgi:hypothetical protein